MSRRYTGVALGVLFVAGAGWLSAQPAPPPHPKEAGSASFSIHPSGDTSLLLDGEHGKTWILSRRGDTAAWLPVARLDTADEAAGWQKATASLPRGGSGLPAGVGKFLLEQGYTAVPLDRLKTGHLTVEARIGGKKLHLSVDTASPGTILDPDRVKHLKLDWQKLEVPGSPGPEAGAAVASCDVEELELGSFKTGRVLLWSRDLSRINEGLKQYRDPLIDGVVGTDVLGKYGAIVDCGACRLYLLSR